MQHIPALRPADFVAWFRSVAPISTRFAAILWVPITATEARGRMTLWKALLRQIAQEFAHYLQHARGAGDFFVDFGLQSVRYMLTLDT